VNDDVDLAYLIHHWSDAYDINMRHGQYVARRRDNGAQVRADSAEALLALIREDYQARPVPRDS
jgi:hypothetical protein